ncbi:fatty acid desaturase [Tabrizicola oligotrophica]|uniref:Fatty acid desaturase n=1 Tax=Tabrizicola oligotrophica TaxID=2710650 RepID=A0A6M0QZG2_9RHOB|nr:fatty acid desaturase [Tabrizicola oligotrophica]NEY91892.1 fatty acid desaturase [Tabrizicola oligotrophica]
MSPAAPTRETEWPTLAMLALTYAVFAAGTLLWPVSGLLAIVLTALAIAQYSSLQHEVLHGHPFRNQMLNDALVFPALTVFVPYLRFKDTHLQHHYDPNLTDPYDDPESNYMDPRVWERTSRPVQRLLRLNNTLLGRILLGPAIGTWFFSGPDIARMRAGERRILQSWLLHALGFVPVLIWLWGFTDMPVWAWIVAAYIGYGLLKIRTYLEHRAHEAFRARTVIIEDKGPLSLLFLNNNLHVVHHCHPALPWYRLPALYAQKADHYRRRNESYVYAGYGEIFRQFLFKAKDPVPHPVWPVRKSDRNDADPV